MLWRFIRESLQQIKNGKNKLRIMEYQYMTRFKSGNDIGHNGLMDAFLNEMSKQGWEMVQCFPQPYSNGDFGYSGFYFIFKKPVE